MRIIYIFFAVISFEMAFGQDIVVVTPDTIDVILYNPGIGVEIFDNNHQPSNYPPSRLFYKRYDWIEIEQEKGVIDYQKIDDMLALARSKGQRVGLRIMAINDYGCETCVPQYVVDAAGGNIVCSKGPYSKVFWPNYNDAYMEAVEDLMIALGNHYDGHPDLNHIDLGFFGCWGEFNNSCVCESDRDKAKMWSYDVNMQNTDIHFATFPNTPIMSMGDNKYSMGKGSGWRGDCFGQWPDTSDVDGWSHMTHVYPGWADNCDDCWEKGMVSFEVCWNCQEQYRRGYDFAETMAKGLEWHMSSMNAKSSPIPAEWQPILDEALKKMGYRLRIARLEHPANISYVEPMKVSMEWSNDGVAPPYHEYILRMELVPQSGNDTLRHDFTIDARDWLPGTFKVEEDITIPQSLTTGAYKVRFALLFPDNEQPAIELGNKGKDVQGWYPLSQVNIVDPYTLTVSIDGGSGSVLPENREFTPGSTVSLSAVADLGYAFSSWSGDLSGSDNPTNLTMDADKSITAIFAVGPTYMLTSSVVGSGSISPESTEYNGGTEITLTATADSGSVFTSWSGDLTGNENPKIITIDKDINVIANFEQIVGIPDNNQEFGFIQNYPNPFSSETIFDYSISYQSKVMLSIYNTYGQLVTILVNQYLDADSYKIVWDGTDASGSYLQNGMYFYQLTIGNNTITQKLILNR